MGVFFISSIVQSNLMQTGAFEIYVNGNLEFSKLETNRMPDYEALQVILRKYGVTIWMVKTNDIRIWFFKI